MCEIDKGDYMKVSKLIIKLSEIQKQYGDIVCVVRKNDDYWGNLDSPLDEYNMYFEEHCQPEGPKSGNSEPGIVFDVE
jgi:hypothetical protein